MTGVSIKTEQNKKQANNEDKRTKEKLASKNKWDQKRLLEKAERYKKGNWLENYLLTLKAKTRVKKEQKTKLYTNIKGHRQNDKLQ